MPCKLKDVPAISIGGFGGDTAIQGIDFSISSDGPSTCTVQIVGEVNVSLNTSSAVSISIGGFSFIGYPVKKTIRCSPTSAYVSVITYVDTSIFLDKTFVGLWGKHVPASGKSITVTNYYGTAFNMKTYTREGYSGSGNLIVVGDFIDPCADPELYEIEDPCDPCPGQDGSYGGADADTRGLKYINCAEQRNTQILDVDYSFSELLGSMSEMGIASNKFQAGVEEYRNNYTGTLRSVLSSWCKDYGLVFSWNASKNRLDFFNATSGISVNTGGLENDCDVLDYEKTWSIQNATSHSVIAYHGREGQIKDYKCSYDYGKRVVCRPLTIKDLVSRTAPSSQVSLGYVDSGGWTLNSYDFLEWLCCLSGHSPKIRESFAWLNVYGCVSPKFIENKVTTSGQISGVPGINFPYTAYHDMPQTDHLNGKHSLPLLNMTIKKAFLPKSTVFRFFWDNVLSDAQKEFVTKNGSIFIAHRHEESFNARLAWEERVGTHYLGKFFIRKYKGISSEEPKLTSGNSGKASYYTKGTPVTAFSDLYLDRGNGGYVDELTNENNESASNFILIDRDILWEPPIRQASEIADLIEIAEKQIYHRIGNAVDLQEKAEKLLGRHYTKFLDDHPETGSIEYHPLDEIFIFPPSNLPNSGGYSMSNLTEYDRHPREIYEEARVEGYSTPVRIGLRSLTAKKVWFHGRNFWFPPQASVRESEGNGRGNHIPYAGGFYVFVRNVVQSNHNKIFPKIELFAPSFAGGNVTSSSLDLQSFSSEDIDAYNWDGNRCSLNSSTLDYIQDKMQAMANALSYSTGQDYSVTITLGCIPDSNFDLGDGLKSISIRLDNGINATYSFSTVHRRPQSLGILAEKHSDKHKNHIFKSSQTKRDNRPYNEGGGDGYPRENNFPTI